MHSPMSPRCVATICCPVYAATSSCAWGGWRRPARSSSAQPTCAATSVSASYCSHARSLVNLDRPRLRLGGRSIRGELAVEVGGGDAAVHEEVAAGDERAVGTHEERADVPDLVWSAGAPG